MSTGTENGYVLLSCNVSSPCLTVEPPSLPGTGEVSFLQPIQYFTRQYFFHFANVCMCSELTPNLPCVTSDKTISIKSITSLYLFPHL